MDKANHSRKDKNFLMKWLQTSGKEKENGGGEVEDHQNTEPARPESGNGTVTVEKEAVEVSTSEAVETDIASLDAEGDSDTEGLTAIACETETKHKESSQANQDIVKSRNTTNTRFWTKYCTGKCQGFLSTISSTIVGAIESAFYNYGVHIGKYPFRFILFCLIFTALSSIGFIRFQTDNSEKQFRSLKSPFHNVIKFMKEHYPGQTNWQMIIFESDNVLDKQVLLEMLRIRETIVNMTVEENTWGSLCAKGVFNQNCKEEIPSYFDNYCAMYDSMEKVCREYSILKIWNYDETVISSRSQEDIVSDIELHRSSLTSFFGKTDKNADGQIKKSEAIKHTWFTDSSNRDASYKWEGKFINTVSKLSENTEHVSVFFTTTSSYGRTVTANIFRDLKYLAAGFFVEFLYVTMMLGRFNLVEQRPILSLLGLSCIGLALVVSYGLSSAVGITYGPINSIMPFLLLGLGVDDMFVIMTAWNNLAQQYQHKELSERIGITMRHAGVSITITSLTDFLAFAIGSTTVLPALRSFCLYAAVGTAAVYFFQATFFVACLALDQRRLDDKRQGFFWCWKLKNWTPSQRSQTDYCQMFFMKVYAKSLFQLPTKIMVLLLSAILFCFSCWSVSNLQQEFDPRWFLPPSSNLLKYIKTNSLYYPPSAEGGSVYFGNVSYLEVPKLDKLVQDMRQSEYITGVESWYEKYKMYLVHQNKTTSISNQTEKEFMANLSDFLYSCEGSKYRRSNFRFDKQINCSSELPPITAFTITYWHKTLNETNEKMEAIKDIMSIVKKMEFTGFAFPYSSSYVTWETNYIIGRELFQNIGIALVMVFLVTLTLLTSLPMSLMVMLCVLLTLVDVGGLAYWWGLTIDTITAIDLVLAIGLSVDYAAHVAHTFMTLAGTRDERAKMTIGIIGPAVFNGGFSTFLSYVFLADSDSYVFQTFFKIFLGLCLFGVFHGLVFLPVLLSIVGPAPYASARHTSLVNGRQTIELLTDTGDTHAPIVHNGNTAHSPMMETVPNCP